MTGGTEGPLSRPTELPSVTRTRADARRSYDRLAPWYDLLAGPWERGAQLSGLETLGAQAGERVLEIGGGPGRCVEALASAVGETGRVSAVDISPAMLDRTRRRLEGAGLSDRVNLLLGDGAALPLGDGTMDAVFMCFVLELFDTPEIPRVVAECERVLVRGGRLVVVGMSAEGPSRVLRRVYEWAHRRFPRLVDCRPILVERVLRAQGLEIRDAQRRSLWGLPLEIVLGQTPISRPPRAESLETNHTDG